MVYSRAEFHIMKVKNGTTKISQRMLISPHGDFPEYIPNNYVIPRTIKLLGFLGAGD